MTPLLGAPPGGNWSFMRLASWDSKLREALGEVAGSTRRFAWGAWLLAWLGEVLGPKADPEVGAEKERVGADCVELRKVVEGKDLEESGAAFGRKSRKG
jgi:hypothetical protein